EVTIINPNPETNSKENERSEIRQSSAPNPIENSTKNPSENSTANPSESSTANPRRFSNRLKDRAPINYEKDVHPLPRIDDTLDRLGGSKIFSTLDLTSGYFQLEIAETDKEKTAFVTPDGHYEFNVLVDDAPECEVEIPSLIIADEELRAEQEKDSYLSQII
ncbi:gag-pol polyprotein-like protein, partial [Dinothrombium tinctorium]